MTTTATKTSTPKLNPQVATSIITRLITKFKTSNTPFAKGALATCQHILRRSVEVDPVTIVDNKYVRTVRLSDAPLGYTCSKVYEDKSTRLSVGTSHSNDQRMLTIFLKDWNITVIGGPSLNLHLKRVKNQTDLQIETLKYLQFTDPTGWANWSTAFLTRQKTRSFAQGEQEQRNKLRRMLGLNPLTDATLALKS